MKHIFLNSLLVVLVGIGLLAWRTMGRPIPEPAIMLFFGTGLIGISRIIKSKIAKR